MYYRRKILLALLEAFDNKLDKIALQKLLMLVSACQEKPDFDFIPYKFGCFSFQANADLTTMGKYSQVREESECWIKMDPKEYLPDLKKSDQNVIQKVKIKFNGKDVSELIRYTYINYPFLAIKSKIARDILSREEYQKILQVKPESDEIALFTIGYEGITLESYMNKLIRADVKVLCDVRKNAFSMKYGFSKSQLKRACEGVDIMYVHFPELGIESDRRTNLVSQSDYEALFSLYRSESLPKTVDSQSKILMFLKEKKRIALTCFEADINQCHRKHLAESISNLPGFGYSVHHL
jgi:hypothetical protein